MNQQLPPLDYSKTNWRLTPEQNDRLNRRFNLRWSVKDCITCGGKKTFKWYAPNSKHQEIVTYDCNCIDQHKMHRYFLYHGIPVENQRMGWEDAVGLDNDFIEFLDDYFTRREDYVHSGTGLYLHGTPGTGKTLVGSIIMKQLIADGYNGVFSSFVDILASKSSGWDNEDDRDYFIRQIRHAEVLMMDDPGKEHRQGEKQIEFGRSTLDEIMRFRGQNSMPTIITSNYRPDKFADAYGDGIGSLVKRLIPRFVKGSDWRDMKRKEDQKELDLGLRRPVVVQ